MTDAVRPQPVELSGHGVRLEPLSPAHVDGLVESIKEYEKTTAKNDEKIVDAKNDEIIKDKQDGKVVRV